MYDTKRKKSPEILVGLFCLSALITTAASAGSKPIMVPPVGNGGLLGLWEPEHKFIDATYGPFELLNFRNAPYATKPDTLSPASWQLMSMGNYLESGLQFATLARLKNRPNGTLLILFKWKDPADTTSPHGVFYHTFLSNTALVIRTKQSSTGVLDTLEFSCADTKRACGKCWYVPGTGTMQLEMTDKD